MVKFWVTFALIVAALGALSTCDMPWAQGLFTFNFSPPRSASTGEPGSGVEKGEMRDIAPFRRIHAEGFGVLDVDVKPGIASGRIEISADDNLLSFVTTRVVDEVLEVAHQSVLSPKLGLRIKVSTPKLEAVHLEGANTLNLSIESSNPLEVHLEGAGRLHASGRVGALTIHSEGAGTIDTAALIAPSVDVTLEGAGKARVHATERLKAAIEGAGSIVYSGDPKSVEKRIEGVGRISRSN